MRIPYLTELMNIKRKQMVEEVRQRLLLRRILEELKEMKGGRKEDEENTKDWI